MNARPCARKRSIGLPRFPALLVALTALACSPGDDGGTSSTSRFHPTAAPPVLLDGSAPRAGRSIYERENCARCHTLYGDPRERSVRDADARDPLDLPGDPWDGEVPTRVGPDLGFEGHRRSEDWQYAHLYSPGSLVRGSTMPASRHLFQAGESGRPIPTQEAVDLVAYLQALGRGSRDLWAEFRSREPEIPPPPSGGAELLERGTELYRRRCSQCHGESGDGKGEAAGLLRKAPRDFVAARYRFRSAPRGTSPSDAGLFRVITVGTGIVSAMPAFYFLPARDRWALVLRIKQFSPALRTAGLRLETAAAPPTRAAADSAALEEGRRSWRNLGCPTCHGAKGLGLSREEANAAWIDEDGSPVGSSSDLTHACTMRAGASPEAIERSILFGVDLAMPAYGESVPAPRALAALRDFVLSLRRQEDGDR